MYLKYHYRFNQQPRHPFKQPSQWQPPLPTNHHLLKYMSHVWHSIKSNFSPSTHITHNLTKPLKSAILTLQQLPDTVIKPADKGGAIVLWPSTQYISEAHRQLHNTNHYLPIQHNPIPSLVRDITHFLNEMKDNGHVDHTTYKFLLLHSPPRTPLFYLLPKLHKPNIPGRPIISGCDCPTDNLSKYIDHYLKPLVPLIPSYIKDTTHFLNTIFRIPTPLPKDTILVTIDVTSLYTNIPNDEGISSAIQALSTLPRHTSMPPLPCFITLFNFILKHNYFLFNNQHYLQIQGTAMGTRMAPSYANIFMASLEQQMLTTTPSISLTQQS